MERGMTKSSLDELRGRIAAGEYAVDSGALAGDILSKFEVIRRVGRWLMEADEADADRALAAEPRDRRGARRPPSRRSQSRSEPLS